METPRPHKILLVEDEDSLRLSLEIKLNMTGQFIVTSCASGEDALDRLQGDTYDVVLLDFRLPGLSGLDVLNALDVRAMIRRYAREGTAVLLSSHNMLEIEYLSDRVALVDKGLILDAGTPAELKAKHQAANLEEVFRSSLR